jgi:hypothetical protein
VSETFVRPLAHRGDIAKFHGGGAFCSGLWHTPRCMRRLYFRLIVPDGPLRRFRLREDFGEEQRYDERSASSRAAGLMLAWCGFSAGCWLVAQGHVPLGFSLEPIVAFSNDAKIPSAWAVTVPRAEVEPFFLPGPDGSHAVFETDTVKPPSEIEPRAASSSVYPQAPPARSDLPRVSYTVSVLHQGGDWGKPEGPLGEPARAAGLDDSTLDELRLDEPKPNTDRALRQPETTSTQPAITTRTSEDPGNGPPLDTRTAPSRSRGYDPFEADFVAVKPTLSLPQSEPSAVNSTLQPPSSRQVVGAQQDRREGSHVLHTGGGCQAAFDASNQVVTVGKRVAGTDATSEDYTAVLSRMNVLSCRPPRSLSVAVCVAVSDRRAVGTTVTTTPGNAAVASCLARQVAGMRFPASTGADLVRTRVDVE